MKNEFRNYIDQEKKLKRNLELGIEISQNVSGRLENYKKASATILFTRLCTTCFSAINLSPKKIDSHWDCISLFSLARNLMEIYHSFFYFSNEEISDDEWELRRLIFELHETKSRSDMLFYLGKDQKDLSTKKQVALKNLVKENIYFKTLNNKKQKILLKGNSAFIISRDEIEEKIGNDVRNFKGTYKFLSNQIHSFPMAFNRMTEQQKGKGVASEVEINYSYSALEICFNYFNRACFDMLNIFPELNGKYRNRLENLG